jgi:hypothetical protein
MLWIALRTFRPFGTAWGCVVVFHGLTPTAKSCRRVAANHGLNLMAVFFRRAAVNHGLTPLAIFCRRVAANRGIEPMDCFAAKIHNSGSLDAEIEWLVGERSKVFGELTVWSPSSCPSLRLPWPHETRYSTRHRTRIGTQPIVL